MEEKLNQLFLQVKQEIGNTTSVQKLNLIYLETFGTKGKFTILIKNLKTEPSANRPKLGKLANLIKKSILEEFQHKKNELGFELKEEWFDVTAPGLSSSIGHLHPQTSVLKDLITIFNHLGYQVAEGPEIESYWYNFWSLNFPKDHPAMDTQQSLIIQEEKSTDSENQILRTQTSSMQVRVMEKIKPPFRVIVPGKCYRYEAVDASHGFEFWQLEGFAVDQNIRLSDLFGTIDFVLRKIMGDDIKLRFACTNFPFVEPGVDTYIECTVCSGKGCSFCKNSGWSEIMPAGMIHPNVLNASKIDPDKNQGFAFAIGLSRIVTLRYGIDDLRLLVTPDLRLLNQF